MHSMTSDEIASVITVSVIAVFVSSL